MAVSNINSFSTQTKVIQSGKLTQLAPLQVLQEWEEISNDFRMKLNFINCSLRSFD